MMLIILLIKDHGIKIMLFDHANPDTCVFLCKRRLFVFTYIHTGFTCICTYVSYVHRPIYAHMETISVFRIWQSVLHVYLVITKPQV